MLARVYLSTFIKKNKLIFIFMILISSITFGLFAGLTFSTSNNQYSSEKYFQDYNYPNAIIYTDFSKKSSFECLKDVNGIKDYDLRFSSLFNVSTHNQYSYALVNTYEDNDFEKFAFLSNKVVTDNIPAYVDQRYAEKNGIHLGDVIDVGKNGKFAKLNVQQIVLKPETYNIQVFNEIPVDYCSYGAIYISKKDLENFLDCIGLNTYSVDINQVLLSIDDNYDKDKVTKECQEKLEFNNIKVSDYVLDEDTPSYKLNIELIGQTSTIGYSIPFAFLIIMCLVFIMFLIQIIKKESREFGVFLSIGYSKFSIYILIVCFVLVISAVTLFVGAALSVFFGYSSYELFTGSIFLPEWTTIMFWDKFFFSFLMVFAAGQIACILSSLSLRKSYPIDALDKSHSKYITLGQKVEHFLVKIPKVTRLALNSILQNYKNFLIIVWSFVASFAMIFSSFSVYQSMQTYMNYTYNEQQLFDAQILLKSPYSKTIFTNLNNNKFVENLEEHKQIVSNISFNENSVETRILQVDNDQKLSQYKNEYGNDYLEIPSDGIILDKLNSDKLGVKIGDYVTVDNCKLEVKAITPMYIDQFQIVSSNQMNKFSEDKSTIYFLNSNNLNKVKEYCANNEHDLFVTCVDDFKRMQFEYKNPINSLVITVVVVAIILGFIVVCTIGKMSLNQQKRGICILRSQGTHLISISNYWWLQSFMQLLFGFILGCPLAYVVAMNFVSQLQSDDSYYPFIHEPIHYLISYALVLLFVLVSHIVVMLIVKKYKISQVIQSRE